MNKGHNCFCLVTNNPCIEFLSKIEPQFICNPVFWDLSYDRHIYYSDFISDIAKRVNVLKSFDVVGERVALVAENSYEWIVWCFAAQTLNNSLALVPTSFTQQKDISNLIEWGCKFFIVSSGHQLLQDTPFELIYRNLTFSLCKCKSSCEAVYHGPSCICFFTSGSTGTPKMVLHSNDATFIMAERTARALKDANLGNRTLLLLPMYHIYAYVNILLTGLVMGIEVAIGYGLRTMLNDLHIVQPSCLFCVPSLLYAIYNQAKRKLTEASGLFNEITILLGGRVKTLLCGGGQLDTDIASAFVQAGYYLLNGYGTTETCGCVALAFNSMATQGAFHLFLEGVDITIGKDDNIVVSSRGNMIHYFGEENLPTDATGRRQFTTQDYGVISDGTLVIKGRNDQILALPNGEKAFTGDIKKTLMQISWVCDVRVFSDKNGLGVIIYVTDKTSCIINEIKSQILKTNRSLPSYMRIANYSIVGRAEQEDN